MKNFQTETITTDGDESYTKDLKKPERLYFRYLLRHPKQGWIRFPVARMMAILNGKEGVPEFAGQNIDIASATVTLIGQKIHKLIRLDRDNITFKSDGMQDEEILFKRMQEGMRDLDLDKPPVRTFQFSTAEVDVILALLDLKRNRPVETEDH
jgi:hypothetical protein